MSHVHDGEVREIELRFGVPEEVWQGARSSMFPNEAPQRASQVDTYFDLESHSFLLRRPIEQWVRLRSSRGTWELTRKIFHYPAGETFASHADEFTHIFHEQQEALDVLNVLGYTELVTVSKERYTYLSIPGVAVAFDAVRGLGWFIEIEALDRSGPLDSVRAQLEAVALDEGLDLESQDRSGYPYLLLERSGRV